MHTNRREENTRIFLAGECGAAALDQAPVLVGLVGAVRHTGPRVPVLRQRNHFKALGAQQSRGCLRA